MASILKPIKWFYHEFGLASIQESGRDGYLIILARTLRMFAYGTNSLILAIFFSALNYTDHQIGIFMSLTLFGDLLLGTFLTLIADRVGRRKVLMGGSVLMIFSGVTFALFENFWILLVAAIFGVISATGGDFGPFRSIEESILSQLTTASTRSDVLAWYVTTSTLGASIGSEASGRIIHTLKARDGWTSVDAYHSLFWLYTLMGMINAVIVLSLSDACELNYVPVPQNEAVTDERGGKVLTWLSSRLSQISAPTRSIMYRLWFLLAVDSLADGMVPYSLTNYYMDQTFHPATATLGDLTSASYFLSAFGAAFAGPLARRIGLINTMVFTHVPSSAAVLLFPFAPAFWMTGALLLLRAGLNNMDQAPRAAFIAAVVKPEERTAAMGITAMARTLAAMIGPSVTGLLAAKKKFWIAFVLAGCCRLAYDFGLYAMFVNMKVDQGDEPQNEVELESLMESDEEEAKISTGNALEVHDSRVRARSKSPQR